VSQEADAAKPNNMAQHPLNLAFRFLLELSALGFAGFWGWKTWDTGFRRYLLSIFVVVLLAVLWGTFRVPGDPGKAPVAIPGLSRLLLEMFFFSVATWAAYVSVSPRAGLIFGALVLIHYLLSYDRILWLLKQ
jgi:hypothetical protein